MVVKLSCAPAATATYSIFGGRTRPNSQLKELQLDWLLPWRLSGLLAPTAGHSGVTWVVVKPWGLGWVAAGASGRGCIDLRANRSFQGLTLESARGTESHSAKELLSL